MSKTGQSGSRAGFFRQPVPVISLLVVLAVTVLVVLAPVIAPYDPLGQDLQATLQGPSAAHWLGTDTLGRDVLTRLLYGGQSALIGAAAAVLVFLVMGTVLGVLAGYLGGWVDRVIGVLVDMLMALPNLIIILAVLAVFSQNQTAAMITLGVMASGNLIRIVRGSVVAQRQELYVDAAVVSGLTPSRIMARHIVPGVTGPVLVQLSLFSGVALSVQTGLGFLGVAGDPPAPSWGGMVGEAAEVMSSHGFFLLVSGGVIAVLTFAFGFIGDGLRDASAETGKQSAPSLFRRPSTSRTNTSGKAPEGARLALVDYSISFDTPEGTKETVHDVSWSVGPGEILGLVGESGSGKTVSALSVLGLLPSNGRVSAGSVFLDGEDITELPEERYADVRGTRIGLISQEPMVALDPSFTIGSQLTEIIKVHDAAGTAAARRRAEELLTQVQLPDPARMMRKYPHELSGGQLQRIVIAISLAGRPGLLIADEPTTALDVTVQAEILDLLRHLRDTTGMSIILVTHDLGVVADLCERLVIMEDGRIVETGTAEQVFYAPSQDYTKALIRHTPQLVEEAAA